MDELKFLLQLIQEYKDVPPRSRRYPKKFWKSAIKLSGEIGAPTVAKELGISYGNLARRIKKTSPRTKSSKNSSKGNSDISFVEIPVKKSNKQMVLELPHNILLKIEL